MRRLPSPSSPPTDAVWLMITLEQYAGPWGAHPDFTAAMRANASDKLLPAVDKLEAVMIIAGVSFPNDPDTCCGVGGEKYGGFRPKDCPIGAPSSKHKQALAVDRYDPENEIDAWCLAHPAVLAECGIWIEHPSATPGWSHWQCVPPKSGRRFFYP